MTKDNKVAIPDDARIRELMKGLGYEHSISHYLAFKQIVMETRLALGDTPWPDAAIVDAQDDFVTNVAIDLNGKLHSASNQVDSLSYHMARGVSLDLARIAIESVHKNAPPPTKCPGICAYARNGDWKSMNEGPTITASGVDSSVNVSLDEHFKAKTERMRIEGGSIRTVIIQYHPDIVTGPIVRGKS